ncbi:hypothetical protein DMT42_25150 [Streptomyces actuosus]|uniref:Uncharacterized protein n=1 Tax=Streptomyces actuosus TaxID=1885 RepID=A0A2U9P6B1_STRAS|nr:hypothetical protein DMT42_25150 [Streptomyces actuosus]
MRVSALWPRTVRPGSSAAAVRAWRWSLSFQVSRVWNRGWRAIARGGLSTSTSRSKGTSWCSYAARSASRTRVSSSRKVGVPDRSARSTRVFTKNPTRSSRASSVRPAIGVPIGTSVLPLSLDRRAARAAWTTMNRLARFSRASSTRRACTSAGTARGSVSPRWVAVAGRGRSVGRPSSSGRPARVSRQ